MCDICIYIYTYIFLASVDAIAKMHRVTHISDLFVLLLLLLFPFFYSKSIYKIFLPIISFHYDCRGAHLPRLLYVFVLFYDYYFGDFSIFLFEKRLHCTIVHLFVDKSQTQCQSTCEASAANWLPDWEIRWRKKKTFHSIRDETENTEHTQSSLMDPIVTSFSPVIFLLPRAPLCACVCVRVQNFCNC